MMFSRVIQFMLFALAVVGVFASMARNAYGFVFLGIACFGLAMLYLVQLTWKFIAEWVTMEKKEMPWLLELVLLACMLLLFGFRALYLYLPYGETIFILVGGLLAIVYGFIGYGSYADVRKDNPGVAWNILFFYSALILFLVSMIARASAFWAFGFGVMGLVISMPFLYSLMRFRKFEQKGKTISLFQYVINSKSKAGLLFIFFISSALYSALAFYQVIPAIENTDRPKAYIELVRDAEAGKEKPVDGKYRHESYKESMEKFLKRHGK